MSKVTGNKRMVELDFLKGVLILLVITFHLVYIGDSYPYIKKVVYTFHMPGFLLLSGYLMNMGKKPRLFLRTMGWLAVPYALMESGYVMMASLLPIRDHIAGLTPTVFLQKLLLHPLGPYWYLHTLILCGTVFYAFQGLMRKRFWPTFLLTLVAYYGLSRMGWMNWACGGYFLTGLLLRHWGTTFPRFFHPSWVSIVLFAALASHAAFLDKAHPMGAVIVFLSISGLLWIHQRLPETYCQPLRFLGRNSLLLYLFSPVFTLLCKFLQPLFSFDPTALLFCATALALCTAGSLGIGWSIERLRLGRYLLGRDKVIV